MKKVILTIIVILLVNPALFSQSYDELNKQFNDAYKNKNYSLAKEHLVKMRELSSESGGVIYNLLCVTSLNNEIDESLKYLNEMVRNGYVNFSQLENDNDLVNLRKSEEYIRIVNDIKTQLDSYKLTGDEQELNIDVPPLMECYAIMLYLGNPDHPLITKYKNHNYFDKIDEYFSSYKDHQLIKKLAKMYPGSPWQNNLRAHHNLRIFYIYDNLDTSRIVRYPIEINHELAGMVLEFAEASDFKTFYNKNLSFYNAMKRIIRSNYSFGSNVIEFFNDNFKDKFSRFNFYFTPLWGGWQHGPSIHVDGYHECFYFGGCLYSSSSEFYYPDQTMQFLALTEFDHATINPLTASFMNDLEPLKGKVNLLNSDENSNYGSLESTLNEYITWAFALQYFYEYAPAEYSLMRKLVNSNMTSRGFNRFDEFMSFYESYINDRDKYPMLKDFYPDIITWIAGLN